MAFTDQCDVFVSAHEDGFNRIFDHIRLQRPSLFNYATQQVAENPQLLCEVIKAHPVVGLRHNPLVTFVDPLPIPGSDYGLNFAVQLTQLRLDFHPGNVIALPPELAPLGAQRFALMMKACAGIGCPPRDMVERLIPPPELHPGRGKEGRGDTGITVLPVGQMQCFCLEAHVVGSFRIKSYSGRPYLEPTLEGFEIVDIKPEGLENSLECYIATMLRLVVLPKTRILLQHAPLDLIKNTLAVAISPMPTSAALPFNPAVEQDQLKAFIKVEVA